MLEMFKPISASPRASVPKLIIMVLELTVKVAPSLPETSVD